MERDGELVSILILLISAEQNVTIWYLTRDVWTEQAQKGPQGKRYQGMLQAMTVAEPRTKQMDCRVLRALHKNHSGCYNASSQPFLIYHFQGLLKFTTPCCHVAPPAHIHPSDILDSWQLVLAMMA